MMHSLILALNVGIIACAIAFVCILIGWAFLTLFASWENDRWHHEAQNHQWLRYNPKFLQ